MYKRPRMWLFFHNSRSHMPAHHRPKDPTMPKRFYHYTTGHGFRSIRSSNTLRGSSQASVVYKFNKNTPASKRKQFQAIDFTAMGPECTDQELYHNNWRLQIASGADPLKCQYYVCVEVPNYFFQIVKGVGRKTGRKTLRARDVWLRAGADFSLANHKVYGVHNVYFGRRTMRCHGRYRRSVKKANEIYKVAFGDAHLLRVD
eukprot:comp13478_c0_seq1/m.9017 comp13478_c0_seq1/g.9017  ORF comp13478_c0_seq1/g.9017 comp13478_c0_seq1/m.9017 type:complete len:202 (-) comp13478_c0_seq1:481-1086(-)